MICPYCKEEISSNSFKCGYCGGLLTENSSPRQPRVPSGLKENSVVPPEIRKWNWGAFFLNWIWGLCNETYIALLVLIPLILSCGFFFLYGAQGLFNETYNAVIGLIGLLDLLFLFVLGAKGNVWAWKNKRWKSIAHFKRIQRIWSIIGVGVFLGFFLLGVLAAISIPLVLQASMKNLNISPEAFRNLAANQEASAPKAPVISSHAIRVVRNGYLENYPHKTIGEAFDKYFADPQWELRMGVDGGIKGRLVVTARGRVPGNAGEEAKFQFLVDPQNQKFSFRSLELDGVSQDKNMKDALLKKMYD